MWAAGPEPIIATRVCGGEGLAKGAMVVVVRGRRGEGVEGVEMEKGEEEGE